MGDIDVLIRSVDVKRALNLLDGCPNWRLKVPDSERPGVNTLQPSFDYQDRAGRKIDLHQRLSPRLSPTGIDRFWANSRPVKYRGLDARILSPTDQIFHDLVHGLTKSLIFAVLITIVSVVDGISVKGGAEGVGRVTTSAVVHGISAIVLTDMIFVFMTTG